MAAYSEFDLLSHLSGGESEVFLKGEGAVYETAAGRRLVDLNEMRVVLGQGNPAFESGMIQALRGVTAQKGAPSAAKL